MEFQAQTRGLMAVAAGQEKAVPVSMGRLRRRRHMGPQRRRWGIRGRWRARREPPTRPTTREHRGGDLRRCRAGAGGDGGAN